MIIQWGLGTNRESTVTTNFPIAFPSKCVGVLLSIQDLGTSGANTEVNQYVEELSTTSFTIDAQYSGGNFYWEARGY